MVYCIDSNIIVWGIKKQASEGQEDMIARAEHIFIQADEYNDFILIPTIVLAEILTPEPPEVRNRYIDILNKSFIIAPFDTRAALKFADILHSRWAEIKNIAAETGTPRQKMKADHMIIATALVNNANCIYSTDNGLKAFANGLIDVRDVPHIRQNPLSSTASQTSMFENLSSATDNRDDDPF